MIFLINASNLKKGGGLQVADSICCLLERFPEHCFIVILSSYMQDTQEKIKHIKNVEVIKYDIKNSISTLLFGRDSFLDELVEKRRVHGVLTIFGPSRWNPRCIHLSGFARAQLIMPNSPYFQQLKWYSRLRERFQNNLLKYMFTRSSCFFYSENPYVSKLVEQLFKGDFVYTITNYYNQVYDHPEIWERRCLPYFDGVTLLTVSANYRHKNLPISIKIARILKEKYPKFHFRFVFTIEETQFPAIEEEIREHFVFIGKVAISECPSLYEQCDVVFLPTLLECFSANYPEAMKMKRPIVTTNMEFARGLCGDAAIYYSPLSADEAAAAIYKVCTDVYLRQNLIDAGEKQLEVYDTYDERANKLIRLLENLYRQSLN